MVRIHLKGHVSRGRCWLHPLVELQSRLDPLVVELLGRLVQDELEVRFDPLVLANELHKSGGSFALTPEALAGLADPAAAGHTRFFGFQLPGADATQDQATVSASPEGMDPTMAEVLLLILGTANGLDVVQGELRELIGARRDRSCLQSLRFQSQPEETVNLRCRVPQALVEDIRLLRWHQCHPPELAVATPSHLGLHHTVRPQGVGQCLEDVREGLESFQGQGDAFITNRPEAELFLCVLNCLLRDIQDHRRSSSQENRCRQEAANLLVEQLDFLLGLRESQSHLAKKDLISPVWRRWAVSSSTFFCLMPGPFPLRTDWTTRGIAHQSW